MANKHNSLSHTKWLCKYHIVFTPKYRRKIIYNQYRESIKEIIKSLCKYKGVEIIEGHLMADHVHMLVSIPPKYSVSSTVGLNEATIAKYIREQEKHDIAKDKLSVKEYEAPFKGSK